MLFTDFLNSISKIADYKLTGIDAHLELAPEYRKSGIINKSERRKATKSAVLLLLFPNKEQQMSFVLIQRASYKGHHAQQISFPGGKMDSSDKSLLDTAIRETFEEIGILVNKNDIVLSLTNIYIPPSNFIVQPYVAVINKFPNFKNNYEVESLILPKIDELLDNRNLKSKQIKSSHGVSFKTPYFKLQNKVVWGATAMILNEFKYLITHTQTA